MREQTVAGGLQRDKEGFPQERGGKKENELNIPHRSAGWEHRLLRPRASRDWQTEHLEGNLGNYRLLGESPAKFIKGMWIEEGWGGADLLF